MFPHHQRLLVLFSGALQLLSSGSNNLSAMADRISCSDAASVIALHYMENLADLSAGWLHLLNH